MDRTIINIVSLVIGGAGIFAALTDYNVPDLLDDYWGRNPFTTKADHIRRRNSVLFATLAVVAIALQALAEVLGDALPDRSYGTSTYGVLLVGALLLTWLLVFMLAKLGRLLARREWLPEVIDSQRKSFEAAIEVILNDGWRHDQLAVKDSVSDPEKYRDINFKSVEDSLGRIERLLDLGEMQGDFRERATRLRAYFPESQAVA